MKGELPPKAMKLPRLSDGEPARPSASELKAVRQLYHYVEALTHRFARGYYIFPRDLAWPVQPEEPDRVEEWRVGVQRAIYRALITTAALIGAYNEPLFEVQSGQNEALRALFSKRAVHCLPAEIVTFAESFPIYKMRPTEEEENETFGFLAQWLKEHILADTKSRKSMEERFDKEYGRAIECKLRGDCPLKFAQGDGSHSDAHFLTLEIMRVLWMCENITELLATNNLREEDKGNKKLRRIGPIPVFGEFCLLAVDYTEAQDAGASGTEFSTTWLHSEPYKNYMWETSRLLMVVGPDLQLSSSFAEGGALGTPLRLRFFGYCLREYVSAVFTDEFFFEDAGAENHDDFTTFLQCATLFSLDDVESRQHDEEDESAIYDTRCLDDAGFLDGSEVLVSSDSRPALG